MDYDMVFEGGGAKGMVFVGALQELEERGHAPARLMGASAGAIMSTFLAAGYTSEEMSKALSETENGQPVFMGFLEQPPKLTPEEIKNSAIRKLLRDVNFRMVPDMMEEKLDDAIAHALANSRIMGRLVSFIELGGFYAAQNFIDWLRTKLSSGTYPIERGEHPKGTQREFGEMSLTDFHAATGVDLSLVASDTTDARLLILNHRTAPELPVVYAVRMSMSFPLLWHEVVWRPEWGTYRERDLSGHTIVDGGMLSNFPIELFLSSQPQVTAVMGEKTAPSLNVLGFLIDEDAEVPNAPAAQAESTGFSLGQLRTVDRIQKLINTMTQAHDKMVIDAHTRFVVRLPARGYGTIEFGMSDQRRNALVAAGRDATSRYFEQQAAAAAGGISFGSDFLGGEEELPQADRIAASLLAR